MVQTVVFFVSASGDENLIIGGKMAETGFGAKHASDHAGVEEGDMVFSFWVS